MRWLLLLLLSLPALATQYYISATGSDSNNGTTTGTAWLSPNHAVNCGDIITAAVSPSYSYSNFASGKWGTVTCSAGNNVAWLICAAFDACKIDTSTGFGMLVSASYWGVQGWEITTTGSSTGGCFVVSPPTSSLSIHHIIFANNVANVCAGGGFEAVNDGNASVDYIAYVGNIAYNAATGNSACYSGFSVYQPVAADSLPGTHIYVAGNFAWAILEGATCNGGVHGFDGNGFIFDTFDGDQGSLPQTYTPQAVMENNIALSNGGSGMRSPFNNANGTKWSNQYFRFNTAWNNNGDTTDYGNIVCGEFLFDTVNNIQAYGNIAATGNAYCYGNTSAPEYSFYVSYVNGTTHVYNNIGWSATGSYSQSTNATGFSYGPNNLFGTNPQFANAVTPGAPSCGSFTSVPACMAGVIANFTPTNSAAVGYGYQPVNSIAQYYDPLFPQWLCNVNLPSGLVSMSCVSPSAYRTGWSH
jgi:hypothetical protein